MEERGGAGRKKMLVHWLEGYWLLLGSQIALALNVWQRCESITPTVRFIPWPDQTIDGPGSPATFVMIGDSPIHV